MIHASLEGVDLYANIKEVVLVPENVSGFFHDRLAILVVFCNEIRNDKLGSNVKLVKLVNVGAAHGFFSRKNMEYFDPNNVPFYDSPKNIQN